MKRQHLFAALLAALGAAPVFAQGFPQSDINMLPQWNGVTEITDFGPTVTPTYGQTFTATDASAALKSFTFYTRLSISGAAKQYRAYVYEWDPAARRPVGSALFASPTNTLPAGTAMIPTTVDTGGIRLVPGKTYVFFATITGLPPQSGGAHAFGGVANSSYAGGSFMYLNRDPANPTALDFSFLFSAAWLQLGGASSWDLAMLMSMGPSLAYATIVTGTQSATPAARALDRMLSDPSTAGGDAFTVATALSTLSTLQAVSGAVTQTLPVNFGAQSIQGVLSSFGRVVQGRNDSSGSSGSGSSGPSGPSDRDLKNKQVWSKAFGSRADQDSKGGAPGFSADSWGVAAGADAELAAGARVGIAYGYAKTDATGNTDLSGGSQTAGIDSHILAIYGNKPQARGLDLVYQADIGLSNSKSNRHIDFGGLNRTAVADYDTYTAHAGVGLNKPMPLNAATTFIPGIRADYTWLKSQGYTESGADSLNLNVQSDTTQALVLGADARLVHKLSDRSEFDAIVGGGYDAINERSNIVSTYAGAPGLSFGTPGIDHSPWLLRAGFGFSHRAGERTDVAIRYDAEGRDGFVNQTVSVKATWAF